LAASRANLSARSFAVRSCMARLSARYSAIACWPSRNRSSFFCRAVVPRSGVSDEFVLNVVTPFAAGRRSRGKSLVLLGQVVKPLIVRDYALQCPITSIGIRLTTVKAGHRPRGDTGVVDDWDHNNAPCPLAFRTSTKFGDNQPLDLILGLGELFHNPHSHRLGSRTNCRLSICGVTEGKSQGSSVAKVVAGPSFHRGYGTEFAGGADQFGDPLAPLRRWLDPRGWHASPATCHRPATNSHIVRWQQWRNAAQKSRDARRWYRVEPVEKQTRWWAGMLTMWGCDGRSGSHRPPARGARADCV
jgi:hypothetical protein